jgi:hypothetical protein
MIFLRWALIKLTDPLPKWLSKFAVLFAGGAGLIAIILCGTFIVDAPLLLTLAQAACFLPFWICVIWPSFALSKDSLFKMSISGLLWRLALALQIGGFFALSLASDIFRSIAAELKFRDATAASQAMIQAMHEQADELTSLALAWMGCSLGFWALALIVFGAIWIRRSFGEIAAIKESPELDKDKIFVVGDRGL